MSPKGFSNSILNSITYYCCTIDKVLCCCSQLLFGRCAGMLQMQVLCIKQVVLDELLVIRGTSPDVYLHHGSQQRAKLFLLQQ